MTSKHSGGAGRVTIILIFVLAVACAGFFFLSPGEKSTASEGKEAPAVSSPPENPPAYVRVEAVTDDKTVRDSIVQNMSIEAQNRVQLTPRVSGRLEKLHVKTGETVTKGQLVATLEHAQQDALIGSTEAQVSSARAETERVNAEMANAKTNVDRYERLLKEGFSTQQQYDSMSTAYASARASYNAAVAKERQASAELGRVKSAKQDYIMYSPLDGTVLSDYSLTQGTMISPSSPILDIADLRKLKASLRVPEIKIFAVKPGMDVLLRFDALPDEEFQGKVSRIDPYVDPSTRSSTVEIELDNEAAGNRLRPGMFGQASLVEREFKNAVLIPANSIQSGDNGEFVFLEETSRAVMKPVKTGLRQGDYVQITEGLVSGDKLIVFGGTNLNDGDQVSVQ
ncbi:MAG: efflux RND transporter periplasmic adaptor subunit [Synergistaceae bacterium]|jgi:RND family efflux transporter MFP subunit|nr:efflux RND transporter periplasmic adaptor subunit [Synergistaceae bacterium]